MKFTPEEVEKLKKARQDNPEFAEMIDKIRAEFPGSKITYLKIGDLEYGERPDPSKCVTPNLEYAMSKMKEKKQKAKTVGEKRRSLMRYKEE